MPSTPLNPPDHPIALRHSHLLAPAPDRLTNTPTTLTVTRENTHSGRDFSIHQLRKDEPLDSFRRTSLLYTVSGRFWSNSQLREIRDSSGRPLLELRRIWWRGQWIVKRAGGVGDELLSAEMRWGIGMKIGARFCNALIAGREGITLSRRGLSPSPNPINRYPFNQNAGERPRPRTAVSSSNIIPASGPGSTSASAAAAATASASASTSTGRGIRPGTAYTRPTPTRRRTISNYPHAPPIARDAPPPYTATVAAGHATHSSGNDSTSNTPSAASSSTSLSSTNNNNGGGSESDSDSESDSKSRSTVLPSYESVRRMRRQSSRHSLRELLDAIEPPRKPAPASAVPY